LKVDNDKGSVSEKNGSDPRNNWKMSECLVVHFLE
jgi:hypothetical protein